MSRSRTPESVRSEESAAAAIVRSSLWLAWQVVRLPLFSLLVVFEPIVRLVFSGLSLLAVLTAFLFESSSAAPMFPFWGMMALSVGCALALTGYYALCAVFGTMPKQR